MRAVWIFVWSAILGCSLGILGAKEGFERLVDAGKVSCLSRFDPSSKLVLTREIINDDYCDCLDGSDEPGTSACLNGQFLCPFDDINGKPINSSWVNDGVCDCCDGSDEYEGRVQCPNTCEEQRAAQQKGYQTKAQQVRRGLKAKRKLEDAGRSAKKTREDKLEKLKTEMKTVEKRLKDAKRMKEMIVTAKARIPKSEQMEKRKMEDGVGVETEKVVESDEKEDEKAMGSDENEDDFFDEEDYDYGSHDGESGGVSEEEEEGKEMDKGRDSSMSEEGERQSDLETVCQNLYSELATYGGSGLQSMMMWMSAKIKSQLLAMAPEESSWSASLISQCEKHAETMVEKLDAERYKLQRSLEEVENSQVENLTSSDAFRGLALKPIKNSIAQYEYELQIFQRVKQFERGSSIGSLGEWSHFDGDKQLYTNGATCWQGPRRSTTVEFVCGDETEILDVQEPERCVYKMLVMSPVACEESQAKEYELLAKHFAPKDEL